jgi:hypothetical protein
MHRASGLVRALDTRAGAAAGTFVWDIVTPLAMLTSRVLRNALQLKDYDGASSGTTVTAGSLMIIRGVLCSVNVLLLLSFNEGLCAAWVDHRYLCCQGFSTSN